MERELGQETGPADQMRLEIEGSNSASCRRVRVSATVVGPPPGAKTIGARARIQILTYFLEGGAYTSHDGSSGNRRGGNWKIRPDAKAKCLGVRRDQRNRQIPMNSESCCAKMTDLAKGSWDPARDQHAQTKKTSEKSEVLGQLKGYVVTGTRGAVG